MKNENHVGKAFYQSSRFQCLALMVVCLVIFYLCSITTEEKSSIRMVFGLLVAVGMLLFMVLKTRIPVFPALIIAAIIIGAIGGINGDVIIESIVKGFGGTLGRIGIVIGFGVMMGGILQLSGAAKTMAKSFIQLLGKGREELALVIIGLLVSLAVFCDSAFIVLTPLVMAISRTTGKSVASLGATLAMGLVISHSLIPPAVGPFGVASLFKVNIGEYMLWSIVIAIPAATAGFFYTKRLGKSIYQVPTEDGEGFTREHLAPQAENEIKQEQLPGKLISFAPIAVPILLILMATLIRELKYEGVIPNMIKTMGDPVVAVGLGLLIAICGLATDYPRKDVIKRLDDSVKSAGVVILVTGGGGALGMVLRDTGTADVIAQFVVNIGLPGVLLPIIISSCVRLIQGSGTVAMITAASITSPMVDTLGISPIIAGLGCSVGSFVFSYFHDTYFWVVNRSLGITEANEQLKIWSVTTTIVWATGIVVLLIINALFF